MTESILIYLILRELFGIRIRLMEELLSGAKGHLDKHRLAKIAQLLAIIIWIDSTKYLRRMKE